MEVYAIVIIVVVAVVAISSILAFSSHIYNKKQEEIERVKFEELSKKWDLWVKNGEMTRFEAERLKFMYEQNKLERKRLRFLRYQTMATTTALNNIDLTMRTDPRRQGWGSY